MAACAKALARLSSLNVSWAFDIEGKGTVDQVVLLRALKRFDPEIFTDESVSEVLATLGASKGGKGSSPVQLQQLDKIVAAAAPVKERPVYIPQRTAALEVAPRIAPADLEDSFDESAVLKTPAKSVRVVGSLPPRLMTPGTPSGSVYSVNGTLVCRSPSCSKHAAVLDEYMDGLICDMEDFRDAVHPEALAAAVGDSPQEMAALAVQLKEKAKEYMMQAQMDHLRPVWDAFDQNHDGMLSLKQCTRLVSAYLKAFVPKVTEVVKSTIELGFELQTIMFDKKVKDPVQRKQMHDVFKKQAELVAESVSPVIKTTLERMLKEDHTEIARELMDSLGCESNGKVYKQDFEEHFVEAMNLVLGPERLMNKLHRGTN